MHKILVAVGTAVLVLGVLLVSTSLRDAEQSNVVFYFQTMHLGSHGDYYSDLLNMMEAHQLAVSPGPSTTTVYIIPSEDLSLVNQSNAMSFAYTSITGTPGGTDGMSLTGEYYIVVFLSLLPQVGYSVLGGPGFSAIEDLISIGGMIATIGVVTTMLGATRMPNRTEKYGKGSGVSLYGGYRWISYATIYVVTAFFSFSIEQVPL